MEYLTDIAWSCASATEVLPTVSDYIPTVPDGISLFDVKNEIFLSYLQGLALRNVLVLRSIKDGIPFEEVQELNTALTKKLAEQRLYLERGVRPLEQRIKYQVDKVVKAAHDEVEQVTKKAKQEALKLNGQEEESDEDEDESEEEEIDELAYRPNPAAFAKPKTEDDAARRAQSATDGVYRPPRVSATTMPSIDEKQKRQRRPDRSATVDEYISHELSTAPVAQPSIGSTITDGGRGVRNARAMAAEAAKRDYEETHLVRLPKDMKKEKAQRARERSGFGGEEWRGLGENLDRITELTRNKNKSNALDKSRKRRAVEDGPRGDGIGSAFDIRRKRLEKKMRR